MAKSVAKDKHAVIVNSPNANLWAHANRDTLVVGFALRGVFALLPAAA